MVTGWDVVHVFEYGETQIIGDTYNGKCATSALTTLPTLLSYLNSIASGGVVITSGTLSSLSLYSEDFVEFLSIAPAASLPERFEWSAIPSTTDIDNLVNEILTLI